MFPLCDNLTGTLVQPSKQSCQHLENDACATEVHLLTVIPPCNKLPGMQTVSLQKIVHETSCAYE